MSTVENCLRIPNGEQKRLDIQAFRHPTKSFRLVSMSENGNETPLAPTKKNLKNQKDFRPTCRMI